MMVVVDDKGGKGDGSGGWQRWWITEGLVYGSQVTYHTHQTCATGTGFVGVTICQPVPVPMTIHDLNPHGFVNP